MQKLSVSKNDILDSTYNWKYNSENEYVRTIQNIINSKPFGDNKFYIHSFVKRVDDNRGIKKMYHHPRLTKPEPVPGSTLMRVDPNNGLYCKILWTLPDEENFGLYNKGKIFADEFVWNSILKYAQFVKDSKNRELPSDYISEIMRKEQDDLSDDVIREIYQGIYARKRQDKLASQTNTKANSVFEAAAAS